MSLKDIYQTPPKARVGATCSVRRIAESMEESERIAFEAMLNDGRWTSPAIYEALVDENKGYNPSRAMIERHRRHACACEEY